MFSRLAPHCGLQPVYGSRVGSSEMHGGFSWSSLGSSLSSGLSRLGSFVGSTASRIGNSEAFKQARQGFLQSGILENAGQLAGQAVNSLVDIGRVKLESDLQKLRDRVASQVSDPQHAPTISQEQLAQLLSAKPAVALANTMANSSLPVTDTAPPAVEAPPEPAAMPPPPKRRKRKRASGWGAALDNLLGSGVSYASKRMCHY